MSKKSDKVERLLGLIEQAEPPDGLAARAAAAAFAGHSIIEVPSFWQRLVPIAAPAAIAVAALVIALWLGGKGDVAGPPPDIDEASVAGILGGGDVESSVIDAVLVVEEDL